jgi:uncharacterized protein
MGNKQKRHEGENTVTVTFITMGFIGLLTLFTAGYTGHVRGQTKTLLGEGDDIRMLGAIRAHANLTEFAPIVIMLIGAAEYMKTNADLVLGMGVVFVVARVFHAIGLIKYPDTANKPRMVGALGTMLVLLTGSVTVLLGAYGIM